jgi:excinuclease ABC subunit B
VNGKAILYADRMTGSMQRAIAEMDRRRDIQRQYNLEHGITPVSIIKSLEQVHLSTRVADARTEKAPAARASLVAGDLHDPARRAKAVAALEQQMREAASNLEFELAAMLRDQLIELKAVGGSEPRKAAASRRRRTG